MDLLYPFMLTIHLLCAITFGGAVIFEVLVLDSLHSTFSIETMHQIEGGIVKRAKKIMPWVVGLLFLTGLGMLHHRFPTLPTIVESSFGKILLIKISLAGTVLVCFITALTLFSLDKMTPRIFKNIHLTVFSCVITIIILAKAMFYL